MVKEIRQKRYYNYTLAYPDGYMENGIDLSDVVFYVGKGTGNRINQHEDEASSGYQSEKCDVIRHIWSRGYQIKKTILYRTNDESEALEKEDVLLEFYASDLLTNVFGIGGALIEEKMRYSSSSLVNLRLEAFLSRKSLGNLAGISAEQIARLEKGAFASDDTISKVLHALSIALGRTIKRDDIPDLQTTSRSKRNRVIDESTQPNVIQRLRLQAGWSRKHLAKLSGVSVPTLVRMEEGNRRSRLDAIEKVLKVLNDRFTIFLTVNDVEGIKLYNTIQN